MSFRYQCLVSVLSMHSVVLPFCGKTSGVGQYVVANFFCKSTFFGSSISLLKLAPFFPWLCVLRRNLDKCSIFCAFLCFADARFFCAF